MPPFETLGRRLSLAVILLPVSGCGGSGMVEPVPAEPVPAASEALDRGGCCTNGGGNTDTPFSYDAITASQQADMAALCAQTGGTWAAAKCPTANMLAGCKETAATPPYIQWYPKGKFPTPSQNEEQLKLANCGGGGKEWIKP